MDPLREEKYAKTPEGRTILQSWRRKNPAESWSISFSLLYCSVGNFSGTKQTDSQLYIIHVYFVFVQDAGLT